MRPPKHSRYLHPKLPAWNRLFSAVRPARGDDTQFLQAGRHTRRELDRQRDFGRVPIHCLRERRLGGYFAISRTPTIQARLAMLSTFILSAPIPSIRPADDFVAGVRN